MSDEVVENLIQSASDAVTAYWKESNDRKGSPQADKVAQDVAAAILQYRSELSRAKRGLKP